ncbi:MAG: ribosome silencing factor [Thermodesulfovibrionales bacterium]|nr:ribosome silencing factor [Thermodesulfovibrionales bacterium]
MATGRENPGPDEQGEQGIRDSLEKARAVALAALDKKALDLVVLDMLELVAYTDFFVICTGTSAPHVEAVVESVEQVLSSYGLKPSGIEGKRFAHWVLMDYGDVVVHVFDRDAREFYELEKLWLDAPRVEVDEDKAVMGR